MLRLSVAAAFAVVMFVAPLGKKPAALPDGPRYTANGQLLLPEDYPEWVHLGAGIDMSYTSASLPAGHSVMNNVFVNPSAYRAFKQTGQWPDGTMLMLENRAAQGDLSINKLGRTETPEVLGLEVHVKDAAHGGWGFYDFDQTKTAPLIELTAACYSCHQQHGIVDTTFVQFYPTALGIARQKGTIKPEFLKELPPPPPAAQ
jgi:hypothetical protein